MNNLARSQFTLKTIMIAMGVVCFLCAFFFAFPWWLQSFMFELITFAVFSAAVSLAIYGKESIQAFGIGACLALSIRFLRSDLWAPNYGSNSIRIFANTLTLATTIAVAGFACVLARRWVLSLTSSATSRVPSASSTPSPPMTSPETEPTDSKPAEPTKTEAPPIQENLG